MSPAQENTFSGWGKWSGQRELVRGLLHVAVGITAWLVVHPLHLDSDLITFLLFVISTGFIIVDLIRRGVARWKKTHYFARFLKWINNEMVCKFFTRDSEKFDRTTTVASVLGFCVGWSICTGLPIGERWIGAVGSLFFAFVDPLAKIGRYYPIKKITEGWAQNKSWGGWLFGIVGGLLGITLLVLVNNFLVPVIPPKLPLLQVTAVFFIGLAVASFSEMAGKKLDNFFIPAGSIAAMTVANWLFFS